MEIPRGFASLNLYSDQGLHTTINLFRVARVQTFEQQIESP